MPKKLDPAIGDVLKSFGFGPEAAWDCHGTWVVYHRVLEQIAAKAGIRFEAPMPLETNGVNKSVAICVTGTRADKQEWSIGEASPGNNKNSYPYAMAEKRGKDRVVLKLIGLHGLAYSEEEADDFRPATNGKVVNPKTGRLVDPKSSSQAKERGDWPALEHELSECGSAVSLAALRREYEANVYPGWSQKWQESADEAFERRLAEFSQGEALTETLEDSLSAGKTDYIQQCHDHIVSIGTKAGLQKWWDGEKEARRRLGLEPEQLADLMERVKVRRDDLLGARAAPVMEAG